MADRAHNKVIRKTGLYSRWQIIVRVLLGACSPSISQLQRVDIRAVSQAVNLTLRQ